MKRKRGFIFITRYKYTKSRHRQFKRKQLIKITQTIRPYVYDGND